MSARPVALPTAPAPAPRNASPDSSSLAALGEHRLIAQLTAGWTYDARVTVGVGDDCAVLPGAEGQTLLLKTDAVVEGIHFLPGAKPSWIGRKALARSLSDLAAMGGRPIAAVITLGLPPDIAPARVRAIYRGLEKLAREHQVNLVGGETTRAAELFLSIALLGECRGHAPVLRSTGRVGDRVYVSGRLGATQQRHHLLFDPRLAEGEWLARKRLASAMLDLSDGLAADLPRLAAASCTGYELWAEAVPRSRGATVSAALQDGEDYELLFTVRPEDVARLENDWPFPLPLHCVGKLTVATAPTPPQPTDGFDHFKKR